MQDPDGDELLKITGQLYEDQDVALDGHFFEDCTFRNCRLKYRAEQRVGLVRCRFENVQWVFAQHGATTVNFIQALVAGTGDYGRTLLAKTFPEIEPWLTDEAKKIIAEKELLS